MRLLLYGLQRSGTNYLEALMKRRYRVRFLNRGRRDDPRHKHFRLYAEKDRIPEPQYANDRVIATMADLERAIGERVDGFVVLSKDPYSWLRSYEAWAKKCGWPAPTHHFGEEYTLFYRAWRDLAMESGRIHFVRYADLLSCPEDELSRLAEAFGLAPRRFQWGWPGHANRVAQSAEFTPERRAYYESRAYLAEYTGEELAELNAVLDRDLMAFLGYAVEEEAPG